MRSYCNKEQKRPTREYGDGRFKIHRVKEFAGYKTHLLNDLASFEANCEFQTEITQKCTCLDMVYCFSVVETFTLILKHR